jgi:hypothetical protein
LLKYVAVFERFFYNRLCHPAVFGDPFLKSGITCQPLSIIPIPLTKILSFTYYTPIQVMDINPIGNQALKANDIDAHRSYNLK